MYKIFKDNKVIAVTDNPIYIKKHPREPSYIPVTESDADGISVPSLNSVFALIGKELDGLEQVAVVRVDMGSFIAELEAKYQADIDYLAIMAGVDLDV